MTKTQALTIADRIAAKRQEIADCTEALNLAIQRPRWQPNPNELPAFDRLTDLLKEAPANEQRQALIDGMNQTIATLKTELQQLLSQQQRQSVDDLRASYVAGLPQHLAAVERATTELKAAMIALDRFVVAHQAIELAQWETLKNGGAAYCQVPEIKTSPSQRHPQVLKVQFGNSNVGG